MHIECVHNSMDMPMATSSPTFGAREPWPEELMHYMCHGFLSPASTQVDKRVASESCHDECGDCFSFSAKDAHRNRETQGSSCPAAAECQYSSSGSLGKSASAGIHTDELANAVMMEVSQALLDMKRCLRQELESSWQQQLEEQCKIAAAEAVRDMLGQRPVQCVGPVHTFESASAWEKVGSYTESSEELSKLTSRLEQIEKGMESLTQMASFAMEASPVEGVPIEAPDSFPQQLKSEKSGPQSFYSDDSTHDDPQASSLDSLSSSLTVMSVTDQFGPGDRSGILMAYSPIGPPSDGPAAESQSMDFSQPRSSNIVPQPEDSPRQTEAISPLEKVRLHLQRLREEIVGRPRVQ
mmetsp:Transcript_7389/g.13138  ORF Transcript_7389/g.13138 Transcript_7389/m.13138 type:complete len:353 (-) Transcript_7389:219-1277(-)